MQGFMDWAMAALTSFAPILVTLPLFLKDLVKLSIQALEMQERVALQKTIQFLVSIMRPIR